MSSVKKQLPAVDWQAWFDGSCKPNPGLCRIATVIEGPQGQNLSHSAAVGHGDSSDAEYQALIQTLEMLKQAVPPSQSIRIHGDSQVVIQDMLLPPGRASALLLTHRETAQNLLKDLPLCQLQWVPRHKNTKADNLLRVSP